MEYKLSPNQWLEFSRPVRERLAEIFSIPKSKGALVENNKVLSDGYTFEDLTAITVPKMQEYLSSEELDFMQLLTNTVSKIQLEIDTADQEERTKLAESQRTTEVHTLLANWLDTLKRLNEQSIHYGMQSDLIVMVDQVFPNKPEIKNETNAKNTEPTTTRTEANSEAEKGAEGTNPDSKPTPSASKGNTVSKPAKELK